MQPQEQRTDAVAQSAQQPRSQSPNLQSKDGDRAQPTHGGCTPCKTAYRLVEGPPEFFLATNPSDEQLAAFKAFVESAMAIRHEVLREGAEGTGRTAEAAGASSSQTRPKAALLSRTVGRPGKGGTPAAGDAVASVSADAAEPANAPAAAPESGDAYPEVPELAGSGRLLRYLQGFDYDVPAASDAYRRHMKWREEMGLNARRRRIVVETMLLPMRPEAAPRNAEVTRFYPTNSLLRREGGHTPSRAKCAAAAAAATSERDGDSLLRAVPDEAIDAVIFDRQGNIISLERPGLLDLNGLFTAISENEFLRWHSHVLEFRCMLLDVLSRKFKRMVRTTSIIDLQGLSTRILNRRALNLLKRTISAASENYPESIGTMYFINTPRTFSTLWSVMRGWLRERTISKITLLGSDAEAALVNNIGGYALPPSIGGNCTSTLADVPPLYEDRDTDLGPGSMILHVGARRCNQAVEAVPKKSIVRWVWVAEDFDVGFSAIWRSQSGDESVLKEHRKYPARKRVSGVLSAENDGTLILVFDNSWGLMSARRVRYKVRRLLATYIVSFVPSP